MKLTALSDNELKILGFDQIKLLQQVQQNITLIDQEFANRKNEPMPVEKPMVTEK